MTDSAKLGDGTNVREEHFFRITPHRSGVALETRVVMLYEPSSYWSNMQQISYSIPRTSAPVNEEIKALNAEGFRLAADQPNSVLLTFERLMDEVAEP